MTQLSAHRLFFQHTSKLAQDLVHIESQVREREQQLLQGVNRLMEGIRQAAGVPQPKPVAMLLQSYFGELEVVLASWQKKVASYDAGLGLRKRVGDSLLVFVYGKVKAGKSSLGNFIATGRARPDEVWMAQVGELLHMPEFFQEERNDAFAENIDHERQGFKVGEMETTSVIQGFCVPGMTWVDSPGLHSINGDNGALANKYVESADLIIYPMNSAQPGRRTDLSELQELLKSGKRILVLITRSDAIEEDVNEAGELIQTRVMKPEQNRRAQEAHVQGELDRLCSELSLDDIDTQVLSISVEYAETHGNSTEAMRESGMQALLDKLQGLLQSEGIELKKQVPMNNLQDFYRKLLAADSDLSVQRLRQPLLQAEQQIVQLQQQHEQIRKGALHRITLQLSRQVDQLVEQYADDEDMQSLEKQLAQRVEQALKEHYWQPVHQLFDQAATTLAGATESMGMCMGLSFERKTIEVAVDTSGKVTALVNAALVVAGTVIGAFFGGPAGARSGSVVASAVAPVTQRVIKTSKQQVVDVGDNREEVKNSLLTAVQKQMQEKLEEQYRLEHEQFLQPILQALQKVLGQAQSFQNEIKEQCHV